MSRLRFRAFLLLVGVVAALASCGPHPAEQRYALTGKVVLVDKRGGTVTVAHDAIPGYMEPMTMPFKLKDERMLGDLGEGDHIQATLVVAGMKSWLEHVITTRETPAEPGSVGADTSHEPTPGSEVPDFTLTDQNGKRVRLRDYSGKPVVVTFIYTRCPLPDYCPLMTSNFADIAKVMKEQSAIYPDARLLSITVDPEFDTPKVLREYGSAAGADFSRWSFATGTTDEVKKIARYFGMTYWSENGQIIHSLRTAVIGPDGKLVELFVGNEWPTERVLADLRAMKTFQGVGVVQSVDRNAVTIQINHEEIPGLMPTMDMPYRVKEKSLLDDVNPGDRVEFSLKSEESGLIVTAIKKR